MPSAHRPARDQTVHAPGQRRQPSEAETLRTAGRFLTSMRPLRISVSDGTSRMHRNMLTNSWSFAAEKAQAGAADHRRCAEEGCCKRTIRTKVAKPAMATRIGVLMTNVKLTASSSALILPMHQTTCHAMDGRDSSRGIVQSSVLGTTDTMRPQLSITSAESSSVARAPR